MRNLLKFWRLKSFTYWLNIGIIGALFFSAPFFEKDERRELLYLAIANLLLREKTQLKIKEKEKQNE